MAKDLKLGALLDFYGDLLTEKQKELMHLYYEEDLSLSEISENEGITRQGVHDSIRRSETVLREFEDKLGLARRFSGMRGKVEEIEQRAEEILQENETYCYSTGLNQKARDILLLIKDLKEQF